MGGDGTGDTKVEKPERRRRDGSVGTKDERGTWTEVHRDRRIKSKTEREREREKMVIEGRLGVKLRKGGLLRTPSVVVSGSPGKIADVA